jgi:HSP20 family protein
VAVVVTAAVAAAVAGANLAGNPVIPEHTGPRVRQPAAPHSLVVSLTALSSVAANVLLLAATDSPEENTLMSQLAVKKVNDAGKKSLPIFEEVARRLEGVERRAFDLFEKRGHELGHDLEDWFKAEREALGWPASELTEKEGAYEIHIALPGVDVKDVEVTATPTEVIVHASAQEEKKTQKGKVLWTEFGSRDFYRRFEVPNPINADKVTAKLENGVLRISAPETATPKDVTAAAA